MAGEVQRAGHGGDEAPSPGELRASHQDRDRAVELLRVAAGDGRLTAEELDQRLELALTARTYGELAALTRDLPAVPGLEPAEALNIDCRSGSAERTGRWVVPHRIVVRVVGGSVKLDFTEAVLTQPVLLIDADVHSGVLKLVTKPGVEVNTDAVSVSGGGIKVKAPPETGRPALLRVLVSGKVAMGSIKARPSRRPLRRRSARHAAGHQ
jgi:hypothetical protein